MINIPIFYSILSIYFFVGQLNSWLVGQLDSWKLYN